MRIPGQLVMARLSAPIGAYGAYAALIWAEAPDQEIRCGLQAAHGRRSTGTGPRDGDHSCVFARLAPRDAGAFGKSDRQLARRAGSLQGQLPAVGVCASLLLVLLEGDYIYVADALLLSWVLAEVAGPARASPSCPGRRPLTRQLRRKASTARTRRLLAESACSPSLTKIVLTTGSTVFYAQVQLVADGGVRGSPRHQLEHIVLARAQTVEVTIRRVPGHDSRERDVLDHEGRLGGEVAEELPLSQGQWIRAPHADGTEGHPVTVHCAHMNAGRGSELRGGGRPDVLAGLGPHPRPADAPRRRPSTGRLGPTTRWRRLAPDWSAGPPSPLQNGRASSARSTPPRAAPARSPTRQRPAPGPPPGERPAVCSSRPAPPAVRRPTPRTHPGRPVSC
jgi:hypothetical protein